MRDRFVSAYVSEGMEWSCVFFWIVNCDCALRVGLRLLLGVGLGRDVELWNLQEEQNKK